MRGGVLERRGGGRPGQSADALDGHDPSPLPLPHPYAPTHMYGRYKLDASPPTPSFSGRSFPHLLFARDGLGKGAIEGE